MNEKLFNKILKKAFELYLKSEDDVMIYGDSYVEFSDRKIEVLNPDKIHLVSTPKGNKIIHTLMKSPKKLYGKSIIKTFDERLEELK